MENKNRQNMKRAGWAAMVISAILLLVQKNLGFSDFSEMPVLFFFNYGIAVAFFIAIIFSPLNKKEGKWWNIPAEIYAMALVLFMMSAFALNYSVGIFSNLAPWAEYAVALLMLTVLAIPYTHKMTHFIKALVMISAGVSSFFVLYLCIYLGPGYGFFFLGALLIGIGLHGLSPLLMLIFLIKQLSKNLGHSSNKIAYSMGWLIPVVLFIYYLAQWNKFDQIIHDVHAEQILNNSSDFPNWVILSQSLPINKFTEKILLGNYVFDSFDFNNWGGNLGMNSFQERKSHDPFIAIALLFGKKHSINVNDRVKILNAVFDGRHFAHRKLWSGDDLITKDIITNVKLYPDYRIAYVEKTLTIKHTDISNTRWNNQQEALYSFYLPEGSVASSLSLWVNGIEEKSRLTTKSKADSAYVSIVGVERRDPALLHWQEGNTVTVTVFPCTPDEDRVFKIGFTVPLELKGNRLVFTNPHFKGHDFSMARETAQIQVADDHWPTDIVFPKHFNHHKSTYRSSGSYKENWKLSFLAESINENPFGFLNHSYQLKPLKRQAQKIDFEAIYIDANKNWSSKDLALLTNSNLPVYYFDGMQKVELDQPFDEFLKDFKNIQFSLFPFHLVSKPEKALILTKDNEIGPNLEEISQYPFATKLKTRFKNKQEKFYVFSFGNIKSPYLKTLHEVGLFHLHQGSGDDLKEIIDHHRFPILELQENEVAIPHAAMLISQKVDSSLHQNDAPDHLLRLHHYNQLMQTLGTNYFDKKQHESTLIDLANEAFIVSPISSLVVLETIKDYERFGIDKNKNSLKNASMNDSGAVPEPGEWLLIILTLMVLSMLTIQKLKRAAH